MTATLGKAEGRGSVTPSDVRDLSSKGFYFTADGRLLSNQGEVLVHTSAGLFYVLRFGSLAPSRGGLAERYLFISAGFDPTGAGDRDDEVKKRLEVLRARFPPGTTSSPTTTSGRFDSRGRSS